MIKVGGNYRGFIFAKVNLDRDQVYLRSYTCHEGIIVVSFLLR